MGHEGMKPNQAESLRSAQSGDDELELTPELRRLDEQLSATLARPVDVPRGLSERVFESTVDRAMAGSLAEGLERSMRVEAPAGLAERIKAATAPTAEAAGGGGDERAVVGRIDGIRRLAGRIVSEPWGVAGVAIAAAVALAVGLSIFVGVQEEPTAPVVNGGGTVSLPPTSDELVVEVDVFAVDAGLGVMEMSFAADQRVRREVAALAADMAVFGRLALVETDEAVDAEIERQLYYYELMDEAGATW